MNALQGGTAHKDLTIYQMLEPKNRHLADVRSVGELPPAQRLAEVLTVTPVELISGKVRAYHERHNQPKGGTDWRDLSLLFLAYPELKTAKEPVGDRLAAAGEGEDVLTTWAEVMTREIEAPDEDGEFG